MNQKFENYFNRVGLWPNDYFVVPGAPLVWCWVWHGDAYYLTEVSYCVLPWEPAK